MGYAFFIECIVHPYRDLQGSDLEKNEDNILCETFWEVIFVGNLTAENQFLISANQKCLRNSVKIDFRSR